MKFDQMSSLNLDTCEYGKAITVQMNPIPSEVYSRFFKLMFCSCHLKPKKNVKNLLMRMRLIAEFHLASNSLSGAINGRIIPKLMQKCSHLTSRNHFNGTEYFPLVKILLTDLMSCSSKNQLHSALCAGLPFLVLISPMLWCTQKMMCFLPDNGALSQKATLY